MAKPPKKTPIKDALKGMITNKAKVADPKAISPKVDTAQSKAATAAEWLVEYLGKHGITATIDRATDKHGAPAISVSVSRETRGATLSASYPVKGNLDRTEAEQIVDLALGALA